MLPPDIDAEARRLQECCDFAAEWQVTAAGFWTNLQMFLGAAAAGLAAIASGSAFSDKNVFAGALAAAAALAAAVLASLRPGERSEEHKKAADEYHALVIDLRMFREFAVAPAEKEGQPLEVLAFLEERAVAMTQASPWAPRRLERKTKKLLADGRRFYDNDGRKSEEPRAPELSRGAQ
jgi:hypothetical protein